MPETYYVGIKGLIIVDNKALLLKSQNFNNEYYWDLPGGRMEKNENIHEALIRELQEELPIIQNIQINNLISAYKHPYALKDGYELVLLIYKVIANLTQITLSSEHIGYKWVNKDELNFISNEAKISEEYKKIIQQNLE